ncbi:MAG: toll/interleukin-1 receptor domain-containing protein [Devosia sp.]|nr:toll/interleukin-1 receptor domain-containing protein [Devosia sp.]
MSSTQRPAIFISHATPDDNAVTLWLGSKLASLGYEVWADIFRLKGGDDWERILEDAIRNKAAKFLLIATPHGVQKQGVRNEVTIAVETAKKIGDDKFIVPLRLADYQSPFLIVQAQYINFENRWSEGLKELLEVLDERGVPRDGAGPNASFWNDIYLKDARQITTDPEVLVSNWLHMETLPSEIFFYDFKSGISIGAAGLAVESCPIPRAAHNRGLISFAALEPLKAHFGDELPLKLAGIMSTDDFLNRGWKDISLEPADARRKFSDIVRQATDAFFLEKKLRSTEVATGRLAWWPTKNLVSTKMLSFSWKDGPSGRRQLVGESQVRRVYWHYGISCWARTSPVRHLRVGARVFFTTDGEALVGDPRRMHKMRRSFCKSWRNDKWRDLLLTFWHWISEGKEHLDISLGGTAVLTLALPPMTFEAPFGILSLDDHHQGAEYEEKTDETVEEEPLEEDDGFEDEEDEK